MLHAKKLGLKTQGEEHCGELPYCGAILTPTLPNPSGENFTNPWVMALARLISLDQSHMSKGGWAVISNSDFK
jgi:hypothetical protein